MKSWSIYIAVLSSYYAIFNLKFALGFFIIMMAIGSIAWLFGELKLE